MGSGRSSRSSVGPSRDRSRSTPGAASAKSAASAPSGGSTTAGWTASTCNWRCDPRLTGRGLPPSKRSARLAEALDIAAGRRRLYVQEPTAFTYPGLPAVQFFDTAQFDWAPVAEAATPAIRAELDSLLSAGTDEFR